MTMQRRHFELIAETLLCAQTCNELGPNETRMLAERFARALYHTNPNFNRTRFLRACGVEE